MTVKISSRAADKGGQLQTLNCQRCDNDWERGGEWEWGAGPPHLYCASGSEYSPTNSAVASGDRSAQRRSTDIRTCDVSRIQWRRRRPSLPRPPASPAPQRAPPLVCACVCMRLCAMAQRGRHLTPCGRRDRTGLRFAAPFLGGLLSDYFSDSLHLWANDVVSCAHAAVRALPSDSGLARVTCHCACLSYSVCMHGCVSTCLCLCVCVCQCACRCGGGRGLSLRRGHVSHHHRPAQPAHATDRCVDAVHACVCIYMF